jgi:hypothetical protein
MSDRPPLYEWEGEPVSASVDEDFDEDTEERDETREIIGEGCVWVRARPGAE